jgi:pimeloyl-ACP methyl ester carboxylesterase
MTTASILKSATTPEGINIRYLDRGSRTQSILFVHGWCCDHSHWRGQLDDFSSEHRCIAVDLRGHGGSDKPDQDYTIRTFVDDVAWLITEIGLDRPVLIGHSMGGCIGLNLTHRHPNLVRALVMVDSPIVPLDDALRPQLDSILAGLSGPDFREIALTFVGSFMFNEHSDPALRDEVIAGMSGAPQRVMHTAIESTLSKDNLPAGPIPVPALFIRAVTHTASTEEISSRYGGLPVAEVNAAHFVQMEQPAETNRIIRQFLDGLK